MRRVHAYNGRENSITGAFPTYLGRQFVSSVLTVAKQTNLNEEPYQGESEEVEAPPLSTLLEQGAVACTNSPSARAIPQVA